VFYVLEGSGIWQQDGGKPVTLKPGDSLHVRPGTVHSHRNVSNSEKLVFLEFVIVEKGQRSTVRMPSGAQKGVADLHHPAVHTPGPAPGLSPH